MFNSLWMQHWFLLLLLWNDATGTTTIFKRPLRNASSEEREEQKGVERGAAGIYSNKNNKKEMRSTGREWHGVTQREQTNRPSRRDKTWARINTEERHFRRGRDQIFWRTSWAQDRRWRRQRRRCAIVFQTSKQQWPWLWGNLATAPSTRQQQKSRQKPLQQQL